MNVSERNTLASNQHKSNMFFVNGNFRILNWRYLPYIRPKISGNIPTKYGPKYCTNVPPFLDPEIPIDLGEKVDHPTQVRVQHGLTINARVSLANDAYTWSPF